jgi:peptidoglycan-associated lipoprotein
MTTLRVAAAAAFALVAVVSCAKPRAKAPVENTSARMNTHDIDVDDDIRKACRIEESDKTPKFDYDSSMLSSADRDVLEQVARCLTTGPLKGRHVELIGRADPRGEVEYNMILGESRASTVNKYLAALGVSPEQMAETSRGELDATGTDESSWQLDRRVDLRLAATASLSQNTP